MYLDCEISLYQVTKNLFNFRMRIFNEAGEELKFYELSRVSWGTGMNMCRAKFLATRGSIMAANSRDPKTGKSLFQDELPF